MMGPKGVRGMGRRTFPVGLSRWDLSHQHPLLFAGSDGHTWGWPPRPKAWQRGDSRAHTRSDEEVGSVLRPASHPWGISDFPLCVPVPFFLVPWELSCAGWQWPTCQPGSRVVHQLPGQEYGVPSCRCVPPAIPGIMFLSGGQTEQVW